VVQNDIQLKSQTLTALQEEQRQQAAQLEVQRQNREQVLVQLNTQLDNQGGELKHLQTDEKQLQALVRSLQELLSDIPVEASQQKPFKALKGQLRWPARGQLVKRFGSLRGNSGLKWQGVLIEAPEGGQVRAVSKGRVAFADWMRGFGLLLIIDHGDGYMSLYGQNEALYKEVGEWVDSGEVVATLGASGGQTEAGLYFEIRHNGHPVNPLSWCAGTPAAVSG
jgi:septal ring factor EnvC (AmiA/AmiB activator)